MKIENKKKQGSTKSPEKIKEGIMKKELTKLLAFARKEGLRAIQYRIDFLTEKLNTLSSQHDMLDNNEILLLHQNAKYTYIDELENPKPKKNKSKRN